MVVIASAAVSAMPRAIGWSLKLSMSRKVSSPVALNSRTSLNGVAPRGLSDSHED
jgi:hypothetical protein